MANVGWGHGSSPETGTGILQALFAYVSLGGQLYGARRWLENPLTLTHVRWQAPSRMTVDAYRDPTRDGALSAVERDVWIQLALTFPPVPPTPPGGEPPWIPLAVDPAQAAAWVQVLRRAQTRRSLPQTPHALPPTAPPRLPDVAAVQSDPWGIETTRLLRAEEQHAVLRPIPTRTPPPLVGATPPVAPGSSLPPPDWRSESGTWQGTWQRDAGNAPEVVSLPCIEVELPSLLDGQVGAAYRADFARDVAVYFARAVRRLPQVSEMRGWMRGDRLVLAARAVVGVGNRPPMRAENDMMLGMLEEALAPLTLPYVSLGFADPAEWIQGAPLPE
jgi:hypothetical protein